MGRKTTIVVVLATLALYLIGSYFSRKTMIERGYWSVETRYQYKGVGLWTDHR